MDAILLGPGLVGEREDMLLVVGPGLVGEREDMFVVVALGLGVTCGSLADDSISDLDFLGGTKQVRLGTYFSMYQLFILQIYNLQYLFLLEFFGRGGGSSCSNSA
jgi:hypothetical protein